MEHHDNKTDNNIQEHPMKDTDQKTQHQQAERSHGKADETKPNLQDGNAVPGQKVPPAQRPGNTK